MVLDFQHAAQCYAGVGACRELTDPTTSLAQQAQAELAATGHPGPSFYHSENQIRLSQVSLNFMLPRSVVHLLRLREASVSLGGTNLALWTSYHGDPGSLGGNQNIPRARTWTIRANLGF